MTIEQAERIDELRWEMTKKYEVVDLVLRKT